MGFKVKALLPCMTYFAAGQTGRGAASLAMQASLVLWPTTYRLAQEFHDARALDNMLSELSVTYRSKTGDDRPTKRFRPVGALAIATQTS